LVEIQWKIEKKTVNPKTHIALFASGAGSNARKIIEFFQGSPQAEVSLIVCNKPEAGVLQIARNANIPYHLIQPSDLKEPGNLIRVLREYGINFIVLAGFLLKIPPALIQAFPKAIVNIHPALLPAYGGKGMYGHHVHEAVIRNADKESGISIHWVDEQYDHGQIIFQAKCPVLPTDEPDDLANRIHQLEHEHYPRIIASVLPNPR
jgi:phosphoribosylglycinamide formyltransferase-1